MQNSMTSEEFFRLFREYNEGIWPIQWAVVPFCIVIAFLAFFVGGVRTRPMLGFLSVLSAWNGVAYFWAYFAPLNSAGWAFGALFLVQALLLAHHALIAKGEIWFGPGVWSWIGAMLVIYAVAFYPMVGMLFGHAYPEMPVLGIAPCPTTIFLIGMLLAAQPPVSKGLLAIPILWSALGTSAISRGVVEDLGLTVAGIAAIGYVASLSGLRLIGRSGQRPLHA